MSDDAVLRALEQLTTRLDRLESKVDSLTAISGARSDTLGWALDVLGNVRERAPVVSDATATMAAFALNSAEEAGIDPVDAGIAVVGVALQAARPEAIALAGRAVSPEAVAVAQRALSPEMLVLLGRVLDRTELLELGLTAGAAVDEALVGRDVAAMARRVVQLSVLLDAPELDALLASGAVEGAGLRLAHKASTAVAEVEASGSSPVGPWGTFTALRDPDVQKAVGFSLAVLKKLGAKLG